MEREGKGAGERGRRGGGGGAARGLVWCRVVQCAERADVQPALGRRRVLLLLRLAGRRLRDGARRRRGEQHGRGVPALQPAAAAEGVRRAREVLLPRKNRAVKSRARGGWALTARRP